MVKANTWGNQGCWGHKGNTKVSCISSCLTFLRIFKTTLEMKGGKT